MTIYALGPVKPWVKEAADKVGNAFGVRTIYGVASRSTASDHPLGLALDFMVYAEKAKGDAIAQLFINNPRVFNITYVIWQQRIWSAARANEGWRPMENRGSITANHMDHVHVSFSANPPAGGIPLPGGLNIPNPFLGDGGIPNPLEPVQQIGSAIAWITEWHNIQRVLMAIFGAFLILFALLKFDTITNAAKTAGKVAVA